MDGGCKEMLDKNNDCRIDLVEGYNSGANFWIMPAKIIDTALSTDNIDNVVEYREFVIYIDEDIVEAFLYRYLYKHFDCNMFENENRFEGNCFAKEFKWNLIRNYYTLESVENLICEIQEDVEEIAHGVYGDYYEIDKMEGYLRFALANTCGKVYNKEESKGKLFMKNEKIVCDFYTRFVKYMKNMIIEGKKAGYELIFFMGP